MITQWVINSLTVDASRQITKYFLKFNINRTNSYGTMIINQILSIVKPMTRAGINNIEINLGKMKMKDFYNDVSLAKK